jgi:hypothetical protein
MTLPNFLIIGAAKSGTTALYAYLRQHPEIFMSTPKELRYFSYYGPFPKELSGEHIHPGVKTLNEYEKYFEGVRGEKIIGEASPMYLYRPGTAEKIKNLIPDVKMLAILRNPIDRAYSSYMHAIRDWKEPLKSFKLALEKEQDRIDQGWDILWHYKNAGLYAEQLARYYEVFDRDKIKVVLHDDLVSSSETLIEDIFKFLEVDKNFKPDTRSRPNVSGLPKNTHFHSFMEKLFMQDNPIKNVSRVLFPKSIRSGFMEKIRRMNLEKRPMPKEIREELVSFYQPDIMNLSKLIQRDVSTWLE